MDEIRNEDIIEFRYKLIDWLCADGYYVTSMVCNDNHTNVMTPERKKVLEDVLVQLNIHFRLKGYDIG